MDISNAHKAHPWHGIDLGENVPEEVRAFIEIVPTDTVKYEVDKASGYLPAGRSYSSTCLVSFQGAATGHPAGSWPVSA